MVEDLSREQQSETTVEDTSKQMSYLLTIGEHFRTEREAKKMSVIDVADHLRISSSIIEAIESDAYQKDDLTTFIRGYIRSYARLLNIPLDVVEEAFKHVGVQTQANRSHQVFFKAPEHPIRNNLFRYISYGIIVLLVILIVVWYFMHTQSNTAMTNLNNTSLTQLTTQVMTTQDAASQTSTAPISNTETVMRSPSTAADKVQAATDPALSVATAPKVIRPQASQKKIISTSVPPRSNVPKAHPTSSATSTSDMHPWVDPDALPVQSTGDTQS